MENDPHPPQHMEFSICLTVFFLKSSLTPSKINQINILKEGFAMASSYFNLNIVGKYDLKFFINISKFYYITYENKVCAQHQVLLSNGCYNKFV